MGAAASCSRVPTATVVAPQPQPQIGTIESGCSLPPEAAGSTEGGSDDEEDDEDDDDESGKEGDKNTEKPFSSLPSVKRDFQVHAKVMTDDFNDSQYCLPSGEIKPRRPLPMIKSSKLINSLQNVRGRWILAEPLNDWPALVNMELISLTLRSKEGARSFGRKAKHLWKKSDGLALPDAATIPKRVRANFLAPEWMNNGWSVDSPGFVWWYTARHTRPPMCLIGETMRSVLQKAEYANTVATAVHVFAHRYPVEKGKETLRDQQTIHTGILVEWSHKLFTSLVELAWLNGCGGYGGKSNWIEDKLANPPHLLQVMSDSMKSPWVSKRTEIRILDMNVKSKEEFFAYLLKYSEKGALPFEEQRFLNPVVHASAAVRIRDCTPGQLAGYLLNYRSRVDTYAELKLFQAANCQTFAADLFGFLAGEPNAQPYSAFLRPVYKQRTMSFLYTPRNQ